ncbi:hypothetical protein HY375_03875 [Candidatus Berkelbacteria bacterium]|nr:hypothetical protein [Candidatus Berkelbacteria bacterium]
MSAFIAEHWLLILSTTLVLACGELLRWAWHLYSPSAHGWDLVGHLVLTSLFVGLYLLILVGFVELVWWGTHPFLKPFQVILTVVGVGLIGQHVSTSISEYADVVSGH